ncbi:MAG TPA: FAD-dependent monooxygenase [Mariniphaga sp.]|nr:FAD-dependent monooxygenase [Mariniphaga sp.]
MEKNNNQPVVIIAGAGPAGLMTACQLSLLNVPFRIVEKKPQPSSHSGAMIIYTRTLEIFQQLGLTEKMFRQGTVVKGLRVLFNGKESSSFDIFNKATNLSAFPFILMIEQSKTEVLLLDFLKENGHNVEWGTEVVDLHDQENEVEVTLRLPQGKLEIITTSYLIAADGDKSRIRDLLNISFKGKTHRTKLTIIECDADVDFQPGELGFAFSKHATAGFFPLTVGRWRIDTSIYGMRNNNRQYTFEKVAGLFNRKTGLGANLKNPGWFSVFYSHSKYANQFSKNRCFLVGDAAHVFTPVGGQGMNTGLQDAHNLAWKIGLVSQNKLVPQVLDTYEKERQPVAEKICKRSGSYFKLAASGLPHYKIFRQSLLPVLLKLFFKALKFNSVAEYFFKKLSGTGITYGLNLLNKDASRTIYMSAPKPGEKLPFLNYIEKGNIVSLQDKVQNGKFLLLIFGDKVNTDLLLNAIKGYQDVLSSIVLPFNQDTSNIYLRFGINTEGWYLIRPDMVVACRSDEPGAEELKAYLHTLFIINRNGGRQS